MGGRSVVYVALRHYTGVYGTVSLLCVRGYATVTYRTLHRRDIRSKKEPLTMSCTSVCLNPSASPQQPLPTLLLTLYISIPFHSFIQANSPSTTL
jgi:hypothetical protein